MKNFLLPLGLILVSSFNGFSQPAVIRTPLTTNNAVTYITLPANLHLNGTNYHYRTNAVTGSKAIQLTNLLADIDYYLEVDATGATAADLSISFVGFSSPGNALTNGLTTYLIQKRGSTTNITMILPDSALNSVVNPIVLVAAASVITLDRRIEAVLLQTNRMTAAQTLVMTNHYVGEFSTVSIPGEASGGTDRNIVIAVAAGELIRLNGAAPVASLTISCTNGIEWEISVFKKSFRSTNYWDLKTSFNVQ